MEFEHKKFGKCVLSEISQKMLEDFTRGMPGNEKESLTIWRGESVRNAVKSGLLVEPTMSVDSINNAAPGLIRWLADCINNAIAEAIDIDPLS